jgi:hypothetical protein
MLVVLLKALLVKNVTLDDAIQQCFSQCFVVVAAVALVVGLKESATTIPMSGTTNSRENLMAISL